MYSPKFAGDAVFCVLLVSILIDSYGVCTSRLARKMCWSYFEISDGTTTKVIWSAFISDE